MVFQTLSCMTRVSGLLDKLADKPGVSVMADRGFTIKDQLEPLNIKLNIPPFMEGPKQLPPEEVKSGRKIASLRIHVERAIRRIKKIFHSKEHSSHNNGQNCKLNS